MNIQEQLEQRHKALNGKVGSIFLTHDMSFDNFLTAINLGKLMYPSIAACSIQSYDADREKTGHAGCDDYGQIRLVIKGSAALTSDGYSFNPAISVHDGDSFSPMIPSIKYSVKEDMFLDAVASRLGEDALCEDLMHAMMDSMTDDVFDEGSVMFAEFGAEVCRATAIRWLFAKEVLGHDMSKYGTVEEFESAELVARHMSDPRYDKFLKDILIESSVDAVMVIDKKPYDVSTPELLEQAICTFYEKYPISEVGGLLRQLIDEGHQLKSTDTDNTLLAALFAKKLVSPFAIDDSRHKLISAAGVVPHATDKSRFTSAIHQLKVELGNLSAECQRRVLLDAFLVKNELGQLSVNDFVDVLGANGVPVSASLLMAFEQCVEYKSEDRQRYFEMKVGGCVPFEAVSHVVVPEQVALAVSNSLRKAGFDIPVKSYGGDKISEREWSKVLATVDFDIKSDCLVLANGMPPENITLNDARLSLTR